MHTPTFYHSQEVAHQSAQSPKRHHAESALLLDLHLHPTLQPRTFLLGQVDFPGVIESMPFLSYEHFRIDF